MIIFNLHAILVGIICLIFCGIATLLMPDYVRNDDLGMIIYLTIIAIVSGICEAASLKGRLFFLPMWFIATVAAIVFTAMKYGIKGIGGLIGIIVAVLIGLVLIVVVIMFFAEKSKWNNAPRKLRKAKEIAKLHDQKFWENIKGSLVTPSISSYNHLKCQHNAEVLSFMEEMQIDWEEIAPLKLQMQQASNVGIKAEIDQKLVDVLEEKIEKEIDSFESEDS